MATRISMCGTVAGMQRLAALSPEELSKILGVEVLSVNLQGANMKYFVGVRVHEDGDIELTKRNELPVSIGTTLYFIDEQALRKELLDYGAEETRITEALKELETEDLVIV